MTRALVHIVTGAGHADRAAWSARVLAVRPRWASLAPRGCPCCSGRIEARVELTRLLRARRPARVLLELADPLHLTALERVLAEWPLSRDVESGRVIRFPEDAQLGPETLGP